MNHVGITVNFIYRPPVLGAHKYLFHGYFHFSSLTGKQIKGLELILSAAFVFGTCC